MKQVALLVLCLVVVSLAVPLPKHYHDPDNVQLLKYENDIGTSGHKYSFEQSDGTKQEQEGELRNAGTDNEIYVVKGKFTWVGPDGVRYTISYVADENGYQPETEEGPGAVPPGVLGSILG